jgi:plastocyanin
MIRLWKQYLVWTGVISVTLGALFLSDASLGKTGTTATASPNASPSPVASPSPESMAGHGSATVSREVTIHLTDQGFVPSYVQSTSGHDLSVTLVNSGTRPHSFTIDALGIDVTVDPGQTKSVVVPSPGLGDFSYVSNAPGDSGMKGELTFYI